VRGLLKIGMVAALVALFGVAAWALAGWRADEAKSSAVVVLVDPPPVGDEVIPLRGRASLYAGAPREITGQSVAVDDAEEVNLEESEEPRFELTADASDGQVFFVYAWMELSNYDIYCDSIALPRMRLAKEDGKRVWVGAATGEPLRTIRVSLRKKCADPQS
jgi:hypothetical protein